MILINKGIYTLENFDVYDLLIMNSYFKPIYF